MRGSAWRKGYGEMLKLNDNFIKNEINLIENMK